MEKYSETAKVRTGDANSRAQIKLPVFLEFMQEAATDHAEIIGVGRDEILKHDLGWALTRLHMVIDKLPVWQESLKIQTWPSGKTKVVAEREFSICSAQSGEPRAKARTQWVLINLKTRRLERIEAIKGWGESIPEPAFDSDMRFTIPEVGRADFTAACTVRKEDIDLNMHVNNAVYLTWALEAVPNDFFNTHVPRELKMTFISEVSQGNPILSECRFEGGESLHSIRLADSGKECARVNIGWTSS